MNANGLKCTFDIEADVNKVQWVSQAAPAC